MLSENIIKIKEDLDKYKDLSRSEFYTKCINEKLKSALHTYQIDLQESEEYLIRRRSTDVLKAITKIQKEQDKEDLEKIIETSKGESNE